MQDMLLHATELRRQRFLLGKMVLRMRSAGVYNAWVSWLDNVMELKRPAGVSYKVLLRWKSQRMAKMYEA